MIKLSRLEFEILVKKKLKESDLNESEVRSLLFEVYKINPVETLAVNTL